MVVEIEDAPRRALSLNHHDQSKDIGLKAGREEYKVRLEEEEQINVIAQSIAIEEGKSDSIAVIETIALRYENQKYVVRVE